MKRVFDIFFVITTLPISLPLFFVGCLLSRFNLNEPIIYSQIRVGQDGSFFLIYKIRTISNNLEKNQTNSSAEISTLGSFLRLSKIDELPQLFNVLKGNMSIIGPRPEQPHYVEEYLKLNPSFNLRHVIKPGITGWSQVNMPKATPKDNLKKLEYDLYYIKQYSWKLDFIILIKTVKIILTFDSN
ncbi:sugar transferase [Tenacibaculum ovolyticum]|uniref:sugar transferase n=1 Tax=Tenacibaculum ovolyticum TaxID=104270 RepID=UPI0003F93796|nr:sugar transferase [Tenacibaculum ovolyticum]